MITSNVYYRVFHIGYNNSIGTAFTIDVEDRQYLITARHVVEGIQSLDKIKIFHENSWKEFRVMNIACNPPEIDIAILAPEIQLSPTLPLEVGTNGLVYGQDIYFLGFPYGMFSFYKDLLNGYPLPLIKKGILSAIKLGDAAESVLVIDGHNNPGFSGGPIVFKEPGKNDFKVAGVISSYRYEEIPVHDQGKKTEMTVEYNTGIVIGYDIKYAIESIKADPKGFLLPH